MSKEFSIAVCGSPRVGKSTIVNAICGRQVANTSDSLDAHTDRIQEYVLNRDEDSARYSIKIYDTPGIESWTETNVRSYFSDIMNKSKPVCMIYCASPGSFLRLDHLQWVVNTCIQSNIFCALVCTNKYSGGGPDKRNAVLRDFHSLLTGYHSMTRDENNIKYYGNVALCTTVNSIVYEDRELGVRKGVEGINELIFGILTSLQEDKVAAWCYAIADNESFWSNMQVRLVQFYQLAEPVVSKFLDEHGKEISTGLITLLLAALKRKL